MLLGPPLEDPIPAAGPGVWVGESPSVARKTTPPWALSPSGGNSERGLSSGPTPSPSPCPQSGVVGEVANRFPGQHRGRLGWSSGQQGKSQVSPGTSQPISLGMPPSHHCTLWSRGSPDPPCFHALKPGSPGSCGTLCPVKARARLRQFERGNGAEGLTPAVSCLPPT